MDSTHALVTGAPSLCFESNAHSGPDVAGAGAAVDVEVGAGAGVAAVVGAGAAEPTGLV